MRLEWHADQLPALVRGRDLYRHRAAVFEDRAVAVLLLAQGPARAWHRSLSAAFDGIRTVLDEKETTEPDLLLAGAATGIRGGAATLLDVGAIEAHGVALSIAEGQARVAAAGSCRAYLHQRSGGHRRVSPQERPAGLRQAFSLPSAKESLAEGDILVIGPSHAFGVAGVASLARLLNEDGEVTARDVVETLLGSYRSLGTGAAAVAVRVL